MQTPTFNQLLFGGDPNTVIPDPNGTATPVPNQRAGDLYVEGRWAGDRAEVDVGISVPPVRLATIPGMETSVVAFATDIPALTRWGTPYLYGPGSVHVAHTDHEYIEVAELRSAVDAYERIARDAVTSGALPVAAT